MQLLNVLYDVKLSEGDPGGRAEVMLTLSLLAVGWMRTFGIGADAVEWVESIGSISRGASLPNQSGERNREGATGEIA